MPIFSFVVASLAAQPAPADDSTQGRHGMVVAAQREASAAGLEILKAGGNAVDAAVAVGYALAVVDPCCGNIGGGGFMLIHIADAVGDKGGDHFVNFRETAPGAAKPDMYLDAGGNPIADASRNGYRAVAVPGTVEGLDFALRRYGRLGHLGRAQVMAPAIALARDGFVLSAADAAIIARDAKRLAADPEAARIFLHPDGTPYAAGERLRQPDLAATLERIVAGGGADAFYRGPIPAAVAAASAAHGGTITALDFEGYSAMEATPLRCGYHRVEIVTSPAGGGGVTLCEILGIMAGEDLGHADPHSPRTVHLTVEAMRRAFFDRNTLLGDPAFITNPVDRLLSPAYAAAIRRSIDPDKATPSATLGSVTPTDEKPQTTHYSVVDGDGNAVLVTYTINGNFGAGVVAPGTGFLLNNEMDDFAAKSGAANMFGLVQGGANTIAPGKRPLSSMSPAFIENADGKPIYVLGSPGGPRIITAVLETIMNLVDFGMKPAEAVAASRYHHQYLPDTLFYETGGLPPDTLSALTTMGYQLKEQGPWGAVELIAISPDGALTGVNDPRRPAGAAMGY